MCRALCNTSYNIDLYGSSRADKLLSYLILLELYVFIYIMIIYCAFYRSFIFGKQPSCFLQKLYRFGIFNMFLNCS